jgi:charged multivesicular body protein 6
MLAGQMSNEDEDEVEDELEALQREVEGPVDLPDAPLFMSLHGQTKAERAQSTKHRRRGSQFFMQSAA